MSWAVCLLLSASVGKHRPPLSAYLSADANRALFLFSFTHSHSLTTSIFTLLLFLCLYNQYNTKFTLQVTHWCCSSWSIDINTPQWRLFSPAAGSLSAPSTDTLASDTSQCDGKAQFRRGLGRIRMSFIPINCRIYPLMCVDFCLESASQAPSTANSHRKWAFRGPRRYLPCPRIEWWIPMGLLWTRSMSLRMYRLRRS